jgi:hypothetical protein
MCGVVGYGYGAAEADETSHSHYVHAEVDRIDSANSHGLGLVAAVEETHGSKRQPGECVFGVANVHLLYHSSREPSMTNRNCYPGA